MPTYDYECAKCGKTFELFQSMKDDALKSCPKEACLMEEWGHGEVRRLLGTGAGLIFKGSGFYITDYRSEKYKDSAKKDSSASTATPSTGSTSTEKPAETKKSPAPEKPKSE